MRPGSQKILLSPGPVDRWDENDLTQVRPLSGLSEASTGRFGVSLPNQDSTGKVYD